jgi:hypothetical protein
MLMVDIAMSQSRSLMRRYCGFSRNPVTPREGAPVVRGETSRGLRR